MLEEISTECPYCGEPIQLLADVSGGNQQYFEDCQVCCRPILISIQLQEHSDSYTFLTQREDE